MELTDEDVEYIKHKVSSIVGIGRVTIEINAIDERLDILHEERRRFRAKKLAKEVLDRTRKNAHDLST